MCPLTPRFLLGKIKTWKPKNLSFLQFVLFVLGDHVPPQLMSGGSSLTRPLASGIQTYDTKTLEWPVTEPVSKAEGLNQVQFQPFVILVS